MKGFSEILMEPCVYTIFVYNQGFRGFLAMTKFFVTRCKNYSVTFLPPKGLLLPGLHLFFLFLLEIYCKPLNINKNLWEKSGRKSPILQLKDLSRTMGYFRTNKYLAEARYYRISSIVGMIERRVVPLESTHSVLPDNPRRFAYERRACPTLRVHRPHPSTSV